MTYRSAIAGPLVLGLIGGALIFGSRRCGVARLECRPTQATAGPTLAPPEPAAPRAGGRVLPDGRRVIAVPLEVEQSGGGGASAGL